MIIAISGATGFIGKRLSSLLLTRQHTLVVLTRNWTKQTPNAIEGCDAVVHLAGEPVAQRWNRDVKQRIRTSRTEGTAQIVDAIGRASQKPRVLVCASAIGYYGSRENESLVESSSPGTGYLPEVCQAWEAEADRVTTSGVRLVKLRIGMVLGREGGALKTMETPFRLGVGGRLGSGKQWMSWIHLEDMVRLIEFILDNETVSGPLNAVSPHPVTNVEFTRRFAAALHRFALFPVPVFAIQLLFGEMASIIVSSQRVLPVKALAAGFKFEFADLAAALKEIYR